MSVTYAKWLPKDDDEAIEQHIKDGWEVKVVDSYHGNFSVLATKKGEEDE